MIKWAEPEHCWAFRAWTELQQYMYRLRLSLDLLLSSYNEKKGAESSRCLCCSVGKHHSWVVSRSDTWRESVLPHDAWHKALCFVKREAGRLIFRRHKVRRRSSCWLKSKSMFSLVFELFHWTRRQVKHWSNPIRDHLTGLRFTSGPRWDFNPTKTCWLN